MITIIMIMIMIITTLGQQYVVKMTDNITKQVPCLWQWCFQEAVIVDGELIPNDYRHKMSHNDDNDDYDKTVSLT